MVDQKFFLFNFPFGNSCIAAFVCFQCLRHQLADWIDDDDDDDASVEQNIGWDAYALSDNKSDFLFERPIQLQLCC
ncbi:hypothetical protein T07_12403 [Trichinella nelsoni]|uniref:Uncharacterized protein n=1 Tax=Trichinella nelsoni TaxID=6336 RepID=A0A0V0RTD4_9BILA|nr:hypothetical protein T07_12403 [Trichinella nelsoni]